MAKKKSSNLLFIGLVLLVCLLFITFMVSNNTKERFVNMKDNFETMRDNNSCGSCRLKNQG